MRPFEDETTIDFGTRPIDARHCGDEPPRARGCGVFIQLHSKIEVQPRFDTFGPVPLQRIEIGPGRMKRAVLGNGLNRLPCDFNGNVDAFALEPIRGEPVFMIGPFAARPRSRLRRRIEHHRPKRELVEPEHAIPSRRLPKCGNSIRQNCFGCLVRTHDQVIPPVAITCDRSARRG